MNLKRILKKNVNAQIIFVPILLYIYMICFEFIW